MSEWVSEWESESWCHDGCSRDSSSRPDARRTCFTHFLTSSLPHSSITQPGRSLRVSSDRLCCLTATASLQSFRCPYRCRPLHCRTANQRIKSSDEWLRRVRGTKTTKTTKLTGILGPTARRPDVVTIVRRTLNYIHMTYPTLHYTDPWWLHYITLYTGLYTRHDIMF